ncbi:tRNA (guanosine(37)-N1)-methyltransferase TrmD [Feifania hominis]|uniref:tRNA (guanine-N(1)-)-methyltransferase n=1 Tax=Feifania hominis TaxID=2763660 RepID=A0A926DBG7_9FIRM|nr:tRNA (guanosine(37)-N1)-methyltransferase TrmD [Feifania hominis]MBC8535171.1 tRNA (guanosine(37)-N1)-methyltransferase TrmD [Feifania hominis]
MRFDILTLFPDMCRAVVDESILGRAQAAGTIEIHTHNIRDYSLDRHRRVDDYPYSGGPGMVMQVDPVRRAVDAVRAEAGSRGHVIYLSPKGRRFTQQRARELLGCEHLILLCGHYEGIDERILELLVDEEISAGDYVLTGGELPALMVVDAVARMVPGVLSERESFENESIYTGLLEYPQYTRPPEYEGLAVPEVLLSGHHKNIEQWKRRESLRQTLCKRPDLLEQAQLTQRDREVLEELIREQREDFDNSEKKQV